MINLHGIVTTGNYIMNKGLPVYVHSNTRTPKHKIYKILRNLIALVYKHS